MITNDTFYCEARKEAMTDNEFATQCSQYDAKPNTNGMMTCNNCNYCALHASNEKEELIETELGIKVEITASEKLARKYLLLKKVIDDTKDEMEGIEVKLIEALRAEDRKSIKVEDRNLSIDVVEKERIKSQKA